MFNHIAEFARNLCLLKTLITYFHKDLIEGVIINLSEIKTRENNRNLQTDANKSVEERVNYQ